MKPIKIKDQEFNLCEFSDDINIGRFTRIKQYSPLIWEKFDIPVFEVFYQKAVSFWNKSQFYEGMQVINDYKDAINNNAKGYDAWEYIFALICNEVGEDQSVYDDAMIGRKIEKFRELGVDAKTVYGSVSDFFQNSPEAFSPVLAILAMIGAGEKTTTSESTL